MDIDEIQVGKDLDELVAEKAMGWRLNESGSWYDGDKPMHYSNYPPPPAYAMCSNKYFKPSTDIAAAWEVIKKMGELGYTCHIEWKGSDRVYAGTAEVDFVKGIYTVGHAVGDASEAICRAALKALA